MRGAVRGVGANNKNYRKPPKLQLKEVNDTVNLICHASPDAGWPKLYEFIDGIKNHFTFAMYDFTATHIYSALKGAMDAAQGKLDICHDPKASTARAGEMREADIMADLEADLQETLRDCQSRRRQPVPQCLPHQGRRPRQQGLLDLQWQLARL